MTLPSLELERLLVAEFARRCRDDVVVLRGDQVAALGAADVLLQFLQVAAFACLRLRSWRS